MASPGPGLGGTHARHNVLVIDDFADTRDALVTMLQTKGFDAVGAESGPVALDYFQAGQRPCVVLLDIRMPEMDGWHVWERMKAHPELAQMAVVVLSANMPEEKRARAAGIREYLRKPVDAKALIQVVERHCSKRETPGLRPIAGLPPVSFVGGTQPPSG